MTRKQKATYWMLAINTVLVNVIFFAYFYKEPLLSLDTLWAILLATGFTAFGHFCLLQEHVFLQHFIPSKEPMLHRIETPAFMDSELFYYDTDGTIRLGEDAPPELVKEVNDYIKSYNVWLAEWHRNNYKGGKFVG
ncbi:hypothetical protein [Bacillus sp. ISL-45]|uniref:hypothetical protein n=1 Tax=Bacillus sp. ISL-45 TaxID=2819128 RepID=UPI001BE83E2A|nr:hypothetical protein [Bacillus sp. ISL-45]MBT2663882.1 hypothetical protein [Bacillus sp. ISL-45]